RRIPPGRHRPGADGAGASVSRAPATTDQLFCAHYLCVSRVVSRRNLPGRRKYHSDVLALQKISHDLALFPSLIRHSLETWQRQGAEMFTTKVCIQRKQEKNTLTLAIGVA